MHIDDIKGVCFDLGNTLIEFGPHQIKHVYKALEDGLIELFGSCDTEKLKSIRDRQIIAPYSNGFKENNLTELCEELIRELYDVVPLPDQVDKLFKIRYESFVDVIEIEPDVLSLLNRLKERYRISLLSNYPCGRSIRDGLAKIGLADMFEAVVVSADVGYVKPHALPFETLLNKFGESAENCVYIGDNWLADVQGAKRAGMASIYISQHLPYEKFEPEDGDFEPDVRIEHLSELENILL
ncbi:MAG: HAD family hydrolase [Kiritimatiellae bacterium]|nr:HAD family hydrolase [Kiritimatiellia bacterium]